MFGKLKWAVLKIIGIEPMTNRDAVLEELAQMPGIDLFVATGLVFNEAIHTDMQMFGLTYDEWLAQPAGKARIFK